MTLRGVTWQVVLALVLATLGAGAIGYSAVQLFYLPETLADQRVARVPDLSGRELEDGRSQAEASGYELVESGRLAWEDVEEGRIVYQIPPPDFYLPRGDTVRVVVSRGPVRTVIPRLEGLQPALAGSILHGLGLSTTPPRREFSNLHPEGAVVGSVPPVGTAVGPGTAVTLILSGGGSFLPMPDVRGLSLAAARDTLDVHTLTVGEVRTVRGGPTASEARVVVSAQNPQPGQRVRRGSAVRLELGERVAPVRETRPNARPTPDLRRTPAEPTVGAPGRAPAELPAPPVDPEAGDPPPSDEDAPF
jgi:serine/threonine-protein kinase